MIRRIFLLVSVILVGTFLYFGYDKINRSQQPETDLYELIPINSVVIIEVSDPLTQWDNLLSNNIIWEEFQIFESIQTISNQITTIDSTIKELSNPSFISDNFSVLISIVPSNNENTNQEFVAVYQLKAKTEDVSKSMLAYLNSVLGSKNYTKLDNGMVQFDIHQNQYYAFIHEGIISISISKNLLSSISKQIVDEQSLLTNPRFVKVKNTSSKDAETRIFIEPSRLIKSVRKLASSKTQTDIDLFPIVGSWMELDVDIKPNEVSMGGFLTAEDSSLQWVSLFKNQEAIKPRVVNFLPNRTAFMMHYGFSEFDELRKKMVDWQSRKMGVDYDIPIKTWDTMYDISVEGDFIQWIDNEIALVIMEPDHQDFTNDAMVWVSSSDALNMNTKLTDWALKVSNKNVTEFYSIQYRNYTIHKLDIPGFLSSTLGREFEIVQENYFTTIDDYLVFANSPATLQWTINRLKGGKTLKNDPHYKSFENRISAESNVFIYTHIAGSPAIYQSLVNSDLAVEIDNYKNWLQKFQVGAIQVSYERDDLYYVNNYWKYNPVYKKESNSLWELGLDHPVQLKPALVKNHYTNATEIFVQDTGNNIYLISNKGKILWKRKIEEPILSKVTQVDVYKNNKLQLAFNTENRIYIIDRNGNDLSNFPILLPKPASAPLAIMDYEKNKSYRLLVPTTDGKILNYGIRGTKIKGWNYSNRKFAVTQKITHLNIKNKDYLVAVYEDGAVKALDRKGNVRINLKSKFSFTPIGNVRVNESSELDNSYILAVTANKEVVKISLTDTKERLFEISLDSIYFLSFADVDKDGSIEILASDSQQIIAYKTDGNEVFKFITEDDVDFKINTYNFSEEVMIGYVSEANNKIYLSHTNGNIADGFPMNGASPFTISDINMDGRLNVITVDEKGFIFAYTIE